MKKKFTSFCLFFLASLIGAVAGVGIRAQAGFALLNTPIVYSMSPVATLAQCTQSPLPPVGNFDLCTFGSGGINNTGGQAWSLDGKTWTQYAGQPVPVTPVLTINNKPPGTTGNINLACAGGGTTPPTATTFSGTASLVITVPGMTVTPPANPCTTAGT